MNKKLFVPLMLAAISLSGCGGATSTTTTTTDTTASTAPASTGTIIADAPAGCPSKTTLTVKTTTSPATPFDASGAVLLIDKSAPEKAELAFGDEAFTAENMYAGIQAGSYHFTFSLANKDKAPIGLGVYTQSKTDNSLLKALSLATKDSLVGFIGDKSKVEIKHVDHKYACGTITVDDGYASVIGDFIANVTAK